MKVILFGEHQHTFQKFLVAGCTKCRNVGTCSQAQPEELAGKLFKKINLSMVHP